VSGFISTDTPLLSQPENENIEIKLEDSLIKIPIRNFSSLFSSLYLVLLCSILLLLKLSKT
jgi:hypothetical protein